MDICELTKEESRTKVNLLAYNKYDVIAQRASYLISRSTKKPVCVIAGVHLDNITSAEIDKLLENTEIAVEDFISSSAENS